MTEYDVVIVGAGPAGGQCARQLSRQNRKVLIIDKVKDFSENNFSSGGAPLEILSDFNLPEETVSAFWTALFFQTKNFSHTWRSDKPLGVVFDFKKLREFLIQEAGKTGNCLFWPRYTFRQVQRQGEWSEVSLEETKSKEVVVVKTKVLVDATGPARAVIYSPLEKQPKYKMAVGLEYLLSVEALNAKRLNPVSLSFFYGRGYIPNGYGWIFPAGGNTFKIGVIRFLQEDLTKDKSLKEYLENFIKETLEINNFQLLDKHGSVLKVISPRQELFYKKNVVAVGDACSSVNWLGAEGIRHGLYSGNLAAETIGEYLDGKVTDLKPYQRRMIKYFGWRWYLSMFLSRLVYLHFSDKQFDLLFYLFSTLTTRELIRILFKYDFYLGLRTFPRALLKVFRK